MAGGDKLGWVDANSCSREELGADLLRGEALRRLHVRLPSSKLLSGAGAFAALWQAVPKTRRLGLIAANPVVLPVLELFYRVFLFVRKAWRPPASCTSSGSYSTCKRSSSAATKNQIHPE